MTFLVIAISCASTCTPERTTCGRYLYINNSTAANSENIQSGFVPTRTSQWIASILTLSIVSASLLPYSWTQCSNRQKNTEQLSKDSDHTYRMIKKENVVKLTNLVVTSFSAALFAVGLAIGGMTTQTKLFAFLDITRIWSTTGWRGTWDPSLMFVMGGGVIVSFLGYQYVEGWNIIKV